MTPLPSTSVTAACGSIPPCRYPYFSREHTSYRFSTSVVHQHTVGKEGKHDPPIRLPFRTLWNAGAPVVAAAT